MPKSRLRHNKVDHANKVSSWKQKQVSRQRYAQAEMMANMWDRLPWYKKVSMKVKAMVSAVATSVKKTHSYYRNLDSLSNYHRAASKQMNKGRR